MHKEYKYDMLKCPFCKGELDFCVVYDFPKNRMELFCFKCDAAFILCEGDFLNYDIEDKEKQAGD